MSNITVLPPPEQAAVDALITAGNHLRIEDSLALLSVTILFYDYFLTFRDEVELIWKTRITPLNVLFLINRYFAPMAIVICMIALFSPTWTLSVCQHFAKFEGVFTEVTVLVAEVMLILRVYAVHKKNKTVLAIMSSIWIAQLCLMSFTLAHSGPVIIPPSPVTYGCILVADPTIGALDIFFVVPSIIFDTVTITLLLIGLYLRTELKSASVLFQVLLRDGVLYFACVVLTNTAWTATGLALSSDLKNILSFFSTVITNVLIGRLTLNLKRQRSETEVWGERENNQYPLLPSQFSQRKLTTTQGSATLVDPDHPTVSPFYMIPGSSAAEFHRVLPKADRHVITPYQLLPINSPSIERLPK